jgi:hypothetical protein
VRSRSSYRSPRRCVRTAAGGPSRSGSVRWSGCAILRSAAGGRCCAGRPIRLSGVRVDVHGEPSGDSATPADDAALSAPLFALARSGAAQRRDRSQRISTSPRLHGQRAIACTFGLPLSTVEKLTAMNELPVCWLADRRGASARRDELHAWALSPSAGQRLADARPSRRRAPARAEGQLIPCSTRVRRKAPSESGNVHSPRHAAPIRAGTGDLTLPTLTMPATSSRHCTHDHSMRHGSDAQRRGSRRSR